MYFQGYFTYTNEKRPAAQYFNNKIQRFVKQLFQKTYNYFKNVNFKPDPQHETMAKLYLNEMRLALKNAHQKLIPNEVKYYKENYPSNTLDNIYEALTWQGLKSHKVQAWLDKGKDTIKIINTNLSGLTKNFCK